jgi:[acyl-carrier-protein] S-malonyltransferase
MTRRIAFLFPGQGAQEVGMGRDLIGSDALADELLSCASAATGEDLARLCLRGPPRRLAQTQLLQPALTAVELALWRLLREAGVAGVVTAGHSLGEIPALAASGMVRPADAVRLAAERGRLMGEAAAAAPGSMIAVTGLGVEEVEAVLAGFAGRGELALSAVNAPSQVTVSGEPNLLDEVADELGGRQKVWIKRLRVSGAWHSQHMAPAREGFAEALAALEIAAPESAAMVFNRDGREASDPQRVRELLAGQLTSPVRFDLVLRRLAELEIGDFVEIGPGRVLRGLIRLNLPDPAVRVHSVSGRRSLERTAAALS